MSQNELNYHMAATCHVTLTVLCQRQTWISLQILQTAQTEKRIIGLHFVQHTHSSTSDTNVKMQKRLFQAHRQLWDSDLKKKKKKNDSPLARAVFKSCQQMVQMDCMVCLCSIRPDLRIVRLGVLCEGERERERASKREREREGGRNSPSRSDSLDPTFQQFWALSWKKQQPKASSMMKIDSLHDAVSYKYLALACEGISVSCSTGETIYIYMHLSM